MIFQAQKSAKDCCAALNQTTKMGNKMDVFLDTMGNERAKLVDQLCSNTQPQSIIKPLANSASSSPGISGAKLSSNPALPSSSNSPSASVEMQEQQQQQPASAEPPSRVNSLESRIAALFNININPIVPGGSGATSSSTPSTSAVEHFSIPPPYVSQWSPLIAHSVPPPFASFESPKVAKQEPADLLSDIPLPERSG